MFQAIIICWSVVSLLVGGGGWWVSQVGELFVGRPPLHVIGRATQPLEQSIETVFFHSSASFIRVFQTCLPANENWDDAWQGEPKYLVTEEVVADKMSFTVSSQVLKPAVLTGKC